jgi:hypothetical protein
MRNYVSQLPDYTCRVTLERFARRSSRTPFELNDRIRLEVAYTGGQELYSWPGDDRFEAGIEDLLPGHGMVSNGSYALHLRYLFVRNVATFTQPRDERCESHPCFRLDFDIPAWLSGYSVSAGNGSARAPLAGSAWFDPESLDILKLEVRVENTPSSVRIAGTTETTIYTHEKIGEADFVLPASSELLLRDRNGTEARNHSTFDRYRRYSGNATIFYGPPDSPAAAPQAKPAPMPAVRQLTVILDDALADDAAIGDPVPVTTPEGVHYTARIASMRRVRNSWMADLSLPGMLRSNLPLPVRRGASLVFRK